MFWADTLLADRKGKEVINDSFTPSGMVHMGSLKGPVIHDTLFKMLKAKGAEVTFMYGLDDTDPIDGLAPDLRESHSQYLGVPIFKAPSPDGNGSFGDYFGGKMKKLLESLDIHPDKLYTTSQLYQEGAFNKAILHVLDNVQKVRDVYGDMYKKTLASDWFPLQVICPSCGKVGTTKVTGWDGKEVSFFCDPELVKWAKGCGTKEKISPLDGNGKLPWKVEWAAKWWTFGVTIEGAGKDHASAGGSYDISMNLCEKVFGKKPPLKLAYEFFLSGGKKMSSSKGIGLTGEELVEVLGTQRARFLMIKSPPNQAVEFTPYSTDSIPKVFDDYQLASSSKEDVRRAFELSQKKEVENVSKIRFATLAQWVQMPNMEGQIKKGKLDEWAKFAKIWVEKYAPESERFLIAQEIPDQAKALSDAQKQFLKNLIEKVDNATNAEEFQKTIYETATKVNLSSKEAFAAIYASLIGKDHGPKAAWLILSLDKEFLRKRFTEISTS